MVKGNGGQDFDLIYERTFSTLMRVVSRMTGSEEAAEDICQEAFIKLHGKMFSENAASTGFPSLDDARFWLFRVAKNLALNYVKRAGRELKAYKKVLREVRPRPQSGEEAYFRKEAAVKVEEALLLMPGKLREALVLKEYGGLPYREIAAVLKISEGNVKVRVFRAREWLAAFFKDSEEMNVS